MTALQLFSAGTAHAQPPPAQEYRIKAVFLFNFAQFVEWPPEVFPGPESPLVIGVLGRDPFGALLDEAVQGEATGTHPLAVRRFRRVDDIGMCHVLFISESEAPRLERILAGLQGRSILTVGDAEDFAQRGVMIRFFKDKNRIRLRINLEAARAARLTISSRLLRPAEIVTGSNDTP
ncbi:MAG: YfiR family protein [Verrucomicrobiota bacterium]